MTWTRRLLLNEEVQSSDSATRRVPLPRAGALSGLELRTEITNGATAGEERVFEALDRVEVVADGSNVLFSLEGIELYRWAHFWLKREPPHINTEAAGAVQQLTLPVFFGRWLGDPEFYLDLASYRDVELRIQYSPTIAATGFATGTTQFHVPYLIDDSPSPPGPRLGFLRTTQIKAFTSAASGEDITELARLYKYFDIMVYCREVGIADNVDITQVELRANDRQIIPFIGLWDDIQNMNEKVLGVDGTHRGIWLRGDTATPVTHTGRIIDLSMVPVFTMSDVAGRIDVLPGAIAGDQVTVSHSTLADAATETHVTVSATRREIRWRARGIGVGNAVLIPFALNGNPAFALDAPSFARLQLVLTQGGAGGEVRISTREWVPG